MPGVKGAAAAPGCQRRPSGTVADHKRLAIARNTLSGSQGRPLTQHWSHGDGRMSFASHFSSRHRQTAPFLPLHFFSGLYFSEHTAVSPDLGTFVGIGSLRHWKTWPGGPGDSVGDVACPERRGLISLAPGTTVLLACRPVDQCNGFDRLPEGLLVSSKSAGRVSNLSTRPCDHSSTKKCATGWRTQVVVRKRAG
jgi:hypothetical protein